MPSNHAMGLGHITHKKEQNVYEDNIHLKKKAW